MNLHKELSLHPIELLPEKAVMQMEAVIAESDPALVVVCDFNILGMETALFDVVFRTQVGARTVLNVDHHVPVSEMMKFISSGNLAANFVRKFGVPTLASTAVKIHHTDCDSVISAAIMRGILSPEARFEEAVIAADHTGQENAIADLLQGLQEERDIVFSLESLDCLLSGKPLPDKAKYLFENRKNERIALKKMVAGGAFKQIEGVAYADMDSNVDAGLLSALLPTAKAIVIGSPRTDKYRNIKVRLTPASFPGTHLGRLGLSGGFGGRWNAGSNKRAGGTTMTTEEYAREVVEKLTS